MKKIKALLAVLLTMAILATTVVFASAETSGTDLKFDKNGNFRIMHITDTHFIDNPFDEAIEFIEKALDDYKPNLVVFGGDNIKGWFSTSMQLGVKKAINKLVTPLEKRNIPFTFVYGNHDWQTYLCPKELQNKFYAEYSNCILPNGPQNLIHTGIGNVLVKDSTGTKNIFNIWLFDSGTILKGDNFKFVENVSPAQVLWYNVTCKKLAKENGGVIPAISFSHFPANEVVKVFEENKNGIICDDGKAYALKAGFTDGITNGVAGRENTRRDTFFNDSSEIPTVNTGLYASWVRNGDVFAAFFGHAHENDFAGITEDNIAFCATASAGGFDIAARYNKGSEVIEARGLRIIDINEKALLSGGKNINALTTFSVYYTDYFDNSIEKYPVKDTSRAEHSFGEWLQIEFGYLFDFISDILKIK